MLHNPKRVASSRSHSSFLGPLQSIERKNGAKLGREDALSSLWHLYFLLCLASHLRFGCWRRFAIQKYLYRNHFPCNLGWIAHLSNVRLPYAKLKED